MAKDNVNRAERVQEMGNALIDSREATEQLCEAIAAQVDAIDSLRKLSAYYGSQDWFKDREAYEHGKLPDDLDCDVLEEDLPFETLVNAREAALAALEVSTAMLRAL